MQSLLEILKTAELDHYLVEGLGLEEELSRLATVPVLLLQQGES